MLATGVATTASTGRLIDRFRDRVMFPVVHNGEVLGFVGRRRPDLTDADKGGPKYLNTADTPLFHKGAQLFGVVDELLAEGAVPVIVEGPMDAIAVTLASAGRYLGVAPLGTSLTDEQASQLATIGRDPIVATDADLAGQVAAERDFWMLTPHGLDPGYARFPEGLDPADLLAHRGPAALTAALASGQTLGDQLLSERLDNLAPEQARVAAMRVLAARPEPRLGAGHQPGARPTAALPTAVAAGPARRRQGVGRRPPQGRPGRAEQQQRGPRPPRGRGRASRRRSAGRRWPASSTRDWWSRATGRPPRRCCSRPTSKATTSAPLPAPWSPKHPWATARPATCATGSFGRLDSANTTPNPPTVTPRGSGATRVLDKSLALRTQCAAASAGRPRAQA